MLCNPVVVDYQINEEPLVVYREVQSASRR